MKMEQFSIFSFSEFLNLSTKKPPSIYYILYIIHYHSTELNTIHRSHTMFSIKPEVETQN